MSFMDGTHALLGWLLFGVAAVFLAFGVDPFLGALRLAALFLPPPPPLLRLASSAMLIISLPLAIGFFSLPGD